MLMGYLGDGVLIGLDLSIPLSLQAHITFSRQRPSHKSNRKHMLVPPLNTSYTLYLQVKSK